MCSDTVIDARSLSKVYLLYNKPEDRLKQMLVPRFKRFFSPLIGPFYSKIREDRARYKEFWALKNVSLSLRPNESLGIIGQNGSGKSTLLQIICGTLTPTSGETFRNKARVAALLELGAGFNPDFTGRENVYLNAALYGLSKSEIKSKMQTIINFAEIGEHIDQPVKTYSSGMFVRLAFSVIANVDADILVIDEALAVGDAYFQQKCMRYLRKFQEHGSIFFVSHDTGAMINFCDRVIWLHHGEVKSEGDPKEVVEEYLAYLYEEHQNENNYVEQDRLNTEYDDELVDGSSSKRFIPDHSPLAHERGFGDKGAEIYACSFCDTSGRKISMIQGGEQVVLKISFKANMDLSSLIVGFIVKDRLGQYIFGDNTFSAMITDPMEIKSGDNATALFEFEMPVIAPGSYSVAAAVASGSLQNHIQHHWLHEAIIFTAQTGLDSGVMIKIPMKKVTLEKTN